MNTNKHFSLEKRPQGLVRKDDLVLQEGPIPEPGDGEFVTRNLYLSLDPAQRGWMDASGSYFDPVPIGAPMQGGIVGEIIASRNEDFAVGEMLYGVGTWAEYSLMGNGFVFRKIPTDTNVPLSRYISLLGGMGVSALIALQEIANPQPGETMVISGAAGNMGTIAGQIGKIMGCRVIGTAGTNEKCSYIVNELGFDYAINYNTTDNMDEALEGACPDGIDIYYDNVGGPLLQDVLNNIAMHGRIVMNGSIAEYNDTEPRPGPNNLWRLLVKRAFIQGFLLPDYADKIEAGLEQLETWDQEGKFVIREDIRIGLDCAAEAFNDLFTGDNDGKLMVKIA